MPGFASRVEDLAVFRRAYRVSLEVHRASLEFPRIEQFALADQIRRASKSICANLAEGFGRQQHIRRPSKSICANLAEGFAKQSYSAAEYRRYLMMAIGSSDETQLWLRYCIDLGYIEDDRGPSDGSPTTSRSAGCSQGLYASWQRSSDP